MDINFEGSGNIMGIVSLTKGEKIMIERGSMVFSQDTEIEGKMNSNSKGIGGFISAVGRSLSSGESFFITEAVGQTDDAFIGIAPNNVGTIRKLSVKGDKQYRLNDSSFLACDSSVTYNMVRQKAGGALFGGTGGFFVMETNGNGDVLVSSFGDMLELDVNPSKPLVIDNQHVVAWDSNLNYTISVASGMFGFTTGEGLVNTFTGSGKVLIQTRNIQGLATSLRPFFPSNN